MKRLPESYAATRESLHAVAEHVMAAAQYAATGKIGLRAYRRAGLATQEFDGRTIVVQRGVLKDGKRELTMHGSTLRHAGEFVGVTPGAPDIYAAATSLDLDAQLTIEADAAFGLDVWYFLGNSVLTRLVADKADASPIQIWPEHFDIATDFGGVNYGASPGDSTHPEPYFYVGPWDIDAAKKAHPDFFTDPWGAALHHRDLDHEEPGEQALAFFQQGERLFG